MAAGTRPAVAEVPGADHHDQGFGQQEQCGFLRILMDHMMGTVTATVRTANAAIAADIISVLILVASVSGGDDSEQAS
jgi:hypothetical protein